MANSTAKKINVKTVPNGLPNPDLQNHFLIDAHDGKYISYTRPGKQISFSIIFAYNLLTINMSNFLFA